MRNRKESCVFVRASTLANFELKKPLFGVLF